MADQNGLIYKDQGGTTMTFASGATLALESGATITHNGVDLVDELAALNGLDATEMGYLNGTTPGTQAASKVVVPDANVNIGIVKATALHLGTSGSETQVTATGAELNYVDISAAGTVEASKAVVVDANKDISSFRNLTLSGALTFSTGGTLNADSGTGTASGGAVTVSKMAGKITSEALTTAAGASGTITMTNTVVAATDMVLATVAGGTNTVNSVVVKAVAGSGSVVFTIYNSHASAALDGTVIIDFLVVKA